MTIIPIKENSLSLIFWNQITFKVSGVSMAIWFFFFLCFFLLTITEALCLYTDQFADGMLGKVW
jgi:energy-converting hydrogenase Eha subunit G